MDDELLLTRFPFTRCVPVTEMPLEAASDFACFVLLCCKQKKRGLWNSAGQSRRLG